jgi:hypothetical protein
MDGARDGGPLPQDVQDRRAQRRKLSTSASAKAKDKGEHFKRTVQTGFDDDRQADL